MLNVNTTKKGLIKIIYKPKKCNITATDLIVSLYPSRLDYNDMQIMGKYVAPQCISLLDFIQQKKHLKTLMSGM